MAYATKAGFFYDVEPTKPGFWSPYFIDSGLVILSRFPILRKAQMTYSRFCSSDAMSAKGALYARIKIGDSILHLFNTHLQANYLHSDFYTYMKSVQYKTYQLKELTEFIDENTKDMGQDDQILVMGDFNISSIDINV